MVAAESPHIPACQLGVEELGRYLLHSMVESTSFSSVSERRVGLCTYLKSKQLQNNRVLSVATYGDVDARINRRTMLDRLRVSSLGAMSAGNIGL